jgi:THAP4-like, heme-binding beta-barrel domain
MTEGRPSFMDAPDPGEYPFEDSHDLRTGPPLHKDCQKLLPFIGIWRGRGSGEYPTIESFDYAQEIRISHDGRPFLAYEARTWLVTAEGEPIRPSHREVGWWRGVVDADGAPTNEVEALFVSPTGIMENYLGLVEGVKLQMATSEVLRTATAKEVKAGQRLYGIVDRALLYAFEMESVGQPLTPHLAARLARIAG